jgi:hypothetical protein
MTEFVLFLLILYAISGFCCSVNEAFALLGCYATSIGSYRSFWTTFRFHLQGSASPLKMGTTGCPETSVTNCQYTLRSIPEEQRSQCLTSLPFGCVCDLSYFKKISIKMKTIYLYVCLFVCLFPWASAASHGCTASCWLIVPPALDVLTLATRCPRAYRRFPHSSGGSWNLWRE